MARGGREGGAPTSHYTCRYSITPLILGHLSIKHSPTIEKFHAVFFVPKSHHHRFGGRETTSRRKMRRRLKKVENVMRTTAPTRPAMPL